MRFKSIGKNMFMRGSLLVFASVVIGGFAGKANAEVGKSGWPVFKKAQSANTRGTTSVTTAESSLSGMFYNPALLAPRTVREAFLFSESGMVGDRMGGLVYGEPLKKGMIAGGLAGYDAGKMELNWVESGALQSEDVYAQRDLLAIVSYGHRFRDKLSLGASLKAASSEIAQRESAVAVAGDLGVLYALTGGITFSAALQNIGGSTKFAEKENPLPTSVFAGGGYTTKIKDYQVLSGVGVTYNLVDDTIAPEVGVELKYQFVSMNVGYRFGRKESAMQFGLGVQWDNMEFGYAYVPGFYLDATHRMHIGYKFNLPLGKGKTAVTGKKAATPAKTSAVKTAPSATVKPATTGKTAPKTGSVKK